MSSIAEQALIAVIKNSDQETARKVVAVVEALEKEAEQGHKYRRDIVALREELQRVEKELYDRAPKITIADCMKADSFITFDQQNIHVELRPIAARIHLATYGRLGPKQHGYMLDKIADDVRTLWRQEAKTAMYRAAYGGYV